MINSVFLSDSEKENLEAEKNRLEEERLKNYDGSDKIISSIEFLEESKLKTKSNFRLTTHIPSLNLAFDGFREGNMIVVSGHSGEGKTQFCQNLTKNFSMQSINSLWFSFEMGEDEFMERFGENVPVFYLPRELKTDSISWLREKRDEFIE